MSISPNIATAAVALIKCLSPEECFLILRRVSHPNDPWSGHFSFPGGKKESEDSDLLTTCIRETREETGIDLEPDHLQERLPLEAAGKNFKKRILVQPFLFTITSPPPLTLNPKEIQSACWLPVDHFQNLELHQQVEMLPGHVFPTYPLDDYYLWGFTYRLLRSILCPEKIMRETPDSGSPPFTKREEKNDKP